MKLSEIASDLQLQPPTLHKVPSDTTATLARSDSTKHAVYIARGLAPEGLSDRCLALEGDWHVSRFNGRFILTPA